MAWLLSAVVAPETSFLDRLQDRESSSGAGPDSSSGLCSVSEHSLGGDELGGWGSVWSISGGDLALDNGWPIDLEHGRKHESVYLALCNWAVQISCF